MRSIKNVAGLVCSLAVALAITVPVWGASGASAAASGASIPIGFMCDCTGVYSSSNAAWAPGVLAWQKWTNAHGGIDGHQVEVFKIDTASNSSNYIPAFRQLTQADHVVAIIPGIASTANLDPVLAAAEMPLVGGILNDAGYGPNPYMFPDGTTTDSQAAALVSAAVKAGHKKFAGIGVVGSGSYFTTFFQSAAPKVGATFIGFQEVSDSAPNYDAQCLAFQGAGANAVTLLVTTATAIRYAQDCASQGYHPIYVAPAAVVTQQMTQVPALNGLLFEVGNIPYYTKAPATANYDAAMKQYESSFLRSSLYGGGSITGWIAGQMLAAAVEGAHPKGPVTSADVVNGMYTLNNSTLGGLTPPLKFTRGKTKVVACYFISGISHGKFTTPFGPKPFCP